jgi:hypothetical protein
MGKFGEAIVAILTAIIGLAIVAVLVSQNAQTSSVLGAFGTSFSQIIGAAVGPVMGSSGIANTAASTLVPGGVLG